jgi:blue copper oxidase
MNIKRFLLVALTCATSFSKAQNQIPIPDTLTGTSINLFVKDSTHQFRPGNATNSIGYNGSYLGPTIILQQGQTVQLNVNNLLMDTTTTHWHGLHVSPSNDGGPHTTVPPSAVWSPSFTVKDKAATYWYHPHMHGMTMEQVIMGEAGLIIVRDSEEAALALPRTYGVDDVPLIFQFKTMDLSNQWVMNDDRDNIVLVNGVLNAFVNSPAQVVRYRILNASSMRVFRFGFSSNLTFHQITSDDGLLDAPVSMTRLTLSPGERAEILVDLSGMQGDTLFLQTFGNELATGVPGGPPAFGEPAGPLDDTTFSVLQLRVTAPTSLPVTTIPSGLTSNQVWSQVGAQTRTFELTGQPMMNPVDWFINGVQFNMNTINFTTQQNNTEIWTVDNNSMMAHPFHIHGNHFYVLTKNGLPPPLNERGRKDVVLIEPQSSVELITKYEDFADDSIPYMYHCHLLHHEDNGMMGQFIVTPQPAGINETVSSSYFNIYPNPVHDALHLNSETPVLSVRVINMLGVTEKEMQFSSPVQFISLDLEHLSTGMYFIYVLTGNQSITQRFIIEK